MNKLKYYFSHLSYVINSKTFLITFVAMILINIQGVIYIDNYEGIFLGMLKINTSIIYNVLLILFCIFNSFTIYSFLENSRSYIIRCETKEKYNTQLIKSILFTCTMIMILNFMICMIILGIKYIGNYTISDYSFYGISSSVYALFFLIKRVIIINLLVLIVVYIKKGFGQIISVITIFLLVGSMFVYLYNITPITSFSDFPLFFGYYFILIRYASFTLEICCTFFYLFILTIFCLLIFQIAKKSNQQVGE